MITICVVLQIMVLTMLVYKEMCQEIHILSCAALMWIFSASSALNKNGGPGHFIISLLH